MRRHLSFNELPGDLNVQDETLGPPPSWYAMDTVMHDPAAYLPYYLRPGFYQQTMGSYETYSFGDREEEIQVNPVEQLQNLKYQQEMSKKIPKEAGRYTGVDPLSPMFREDKAKFGFGNMDGIGGTTHVTLSTISAALSAYHGYRRNNSVAGAVIWFLLGGALPVLVPAIAFAQGFGKPAKKRCKRKTRR